MVGIYDRKKLQVLLLPHTSMADLVPKWYVWQIDATGRRNKTQLNRALINSQVFCLNHIIYSLQLYEESFIIFFHFTD